MIMTKACHGCGVEKDPEALEAYPYPESDRICTDPVPPLFELDCEPWEPFDRDGPWRRVTVCHHCFEKLDLDMWISSNCWAKLHPVVPFDRLPLLKPAE